LTFIQYFLQILGSYFSHTNTVILLEPYCGTITEPGLPMVMLYYVLFARYLHIPLMDAERAWSHAMELKLLANTELRKKFHYIRRLRKAASHASQLEELCHAEACDARTKLESQVL